MDTVDFSNENNATSIAKNDVSANEVTNTAPEMNVVDVEITKTTEIVSNEQTNGNEEEIQPEAPDGNLETVEANKEIETIAVPEENCEMDESSNKESAGLTEIVSIEKEEIQIEAPDDLVETGKENETTTVPEENKNCEMDDSSMNKESVVLPEIVPDNKAMQEMSLELEENEESAINSDEKNFEEPEQLQEAEELSESVPEAEENDESERTDTETEKLGLVEGKLDFNILVNKKEAEEKETPEITKQPMTAEEILRNNPIIFRKFDLEKPYLQTTPIFPKPEEKETDLETSTLNNLEPGALSKELTSSALSLSQRGGKYNKCIAPIPPQDKSATDEPTPETVSVNEPASQPDSHPIRATLVLKQGVVKQVPTVSEEPKTIFLSTPTKLKRKTKPKAQKPDAISRLMKLPKRLSFWGNKEEDISELSDDSAEENKKTKREPSE